MTEAERRQQINLNKKLMDYAVNTVTQTYVMTENVNDVLSTTRHVHIMTEEESYGLPNKVITIDGLRAKFLRVIADLQDTVFDLRAERDELKCKLDEAMADLKSRRGLYKIQTEQLKNADLRVERTKAYLEEIKSERDLWKLEAERWREIRA